MKNVCIALLLFFGNQSNTYSFSVGDYYHLINEAELLISTGKTKQALEHYDKAFTILSEPLGKDLYNAWICAYATDDTNRFARYSTRLIKRGAVFMKEGVYEKCLLDVPNGPEISQYSSIWMRLLRDVKSEADTAYHNRMQKFVEDDQEARQYFSRQVGNRYNIVGRDSLEYFDSLNVMAMQQFWLSKGFGTEKKTGYDYNHPANPPTCALILSHDRSWNNRKTLDSLLYNKVMSGDFPPQAYALFKDESYLSFKDSVAVYQPHSGCVYATFIFLDLNDTLYIERLSNYDVPRINANRDAIYLESLQDMLTKGKYQFEHPYYKFLVGEFFRRIEGPDITEPFRNEIQKNAYSGKEAASFNTIRNRSCPYNLKH